MQFKNFSSLPLGLLVRSVASRIDFLVAHGVKWLDTLVCAISEAIIMNQRLRAINNLLLQKISHWSHALPSILLHTVGSHQRSLHQKTQKQRLKLEIINEIKFIMEQS